MPLKKKFIDMGKLNLQVNEYLANELSNSGFAGTEIQKTPLGHRLTINTARPGLVIGRKGSRIKEISREIADKFGLENPQIEVESVDVPELNANIMAEALAFGIRKGQNYRRTAYSIMRRIIRAGARGVEVSISGKSTSQRARTQIFRSGIISKCGGPALEAVDKGIAEVVLKSGTLGIQVKIMPLDYRLPDEIIMKDPELQQRMDEIKRQRASQLDVEDYIIDKGSSEIVIDEDEEEDSIFDDVDEDEIEDIEVEDIEIEDTEKEKSKVKKKTSKKKTTKKKTSKKKTTKKKISKKKTTKKKSTKKTEEKTEETKEKIEETKEKIEEKEDMKEDKKEEKKKKKRGRKSKKKE